MVNNSPPLFFLQHCSRGGGSHGVSVGSASGHVTHGIKFLGRKLMSGHLERIKGHKGSANPYILLWIFFSSRDENNLW